MFSKRRSHLTIISNKTNNKKHEEILASEKYKIQKQPSVGVLIKRCSENMSKFAGEHPRQSVISIKLQSNFIEIKLRHGCSPINLLSPG